MLLIVARGDAAAQPEASDAEDGVEDLGENSLGLFHMGQTGLATEPAGHNIGYGEHDGCNLVDYDDMMDWLTHQGCKWMVRNSGTVCFHIPVERLSAQLRCLHLS